ncbi:hypothetical protein HJC23_010150 [Cyclotella cryptica]|uniref:Uncharacterized protein n=1 Tax=Cyclotella cryptica TaxID=29204 RepID=A0ABD3NWA1_9STRA
MHPTIHRLTMHRRRCIADDASQTMHRRRAAVMPSTLSTTLLLDINPEIDGTSSVPKGGHHDVNTTAQHPNNPQNTIMKMRRQWSTSPHTSKLHSSDSSQHQWSHDIVNLP